MTGSELKRALIDLGYSQAGFASLLSEHGPGTVPPATVNRWCTGKHPVPAGVALSVTLLRRLHDDARRFLPGR